MEHKKVKQANILFAGLLGIIGEDALQTNIPKKLLARDICIQCGEKIPPGKPGRKCVKCREDSKDK